MSKRTVGFSSLGWEEYLYWQKTDKRLLKKINHLIKDVSRDDPFIGIGKPEPLKENFAGLWSRRITDEHRFVYKVEDEQIIVYSCRYHYGKN